MSNKNLTLPEFKQIYGRPALEKLALSVGSSVDYFDSLCRLDKNGKPARKPGITGGDDSLVSKIISARPELFTRQSLRPDIYA